MKKFADEDTGGADIQERKGEGCEVAHTGNTWALMATVTVINSLSKITLHSR